MAKLWTQSIHSKCLRFTQRPALDPSLGRKIARRLTGGLGVWKTAASDTYTPLPLRGTSTAKKSRRKAKARARALTVQATAFQRTQVESPSDVSSSPSLLWGL